MIFPGVLSFFQVFQVEWEPCNCQFTCEQTDSSKKRKVEIVFNCCMEYANHFSGCGKFAKTLKTFTLKC